MPVEAILTSTCDVYLNLDSSNSFHQSYSLQLHTDLHCPGPSVCK